LLSQFNKKQGHYFLSIYNTNKTTLLKNFPSVIQSVREAIIMKMFSKEQQDNDDDSIDDLRYMHEDELPMSSQTISDCSSSNSSMSHNSPQSPHYHRQRRSLRQSFVEALASPVKKARTFTINHSPSKFGAAGLSSGRRSLKSPSKNLLKGGGEGKNWQKQFDLPPNTRSDQAMAVLLCREFEMMDM
jgi:hypothetical protein